MLHGRGLLSDIDVSFARFIGRNAGGDPALALLAALVSNAASAHREIALPAEKIGTRESLGRYLKNLSPSEDAELLSRESDIPLNLGFIDRMDAWPPEPGAFPLLFRVYDSESDKAFEPAPLILANGLYYLGRTFQNELFLRDCLTRSSSPISARWPRSISFCRPSPRWRVIRSMRSGFSTASR